MTTFKVIYRPYCIETGSVGRPLLRGHKIELWQDGILLDHHYALTKLDLRMQQTIFGQIVESLGGTITIESSSLTEYHYPSRIMALGNRLYTSKADMLQSV